MTVVSWNEVLCSMQFRQQLIFVSLVSFCISSIAAVKYPSHCQWISIVILLWGFWGTKKRAELKKELTELIAEVSKLNNAKEKELADTDMKAEKQRDAKMVEELTERIEKRVVELEKELAKEKEKKLACMKAEKKRAAELKRRIADSVAELADMNLEVSKLEMEGDRKNTREEECIVEKELALNAEKKRVAELEKELDDRNAQVTKLQCELKAFLRPLAPSSRAATLIEP